MQPNEKMKVIWHQTITERFPECVHVLMILVQEKQVIA
jgi:hypothetical protein